MPRAAAALCLLLAGCATGATRSAAMTSGFVDVNDGRLYYETAGQGDAVVLLHGGFGDRRMWDDHFERFARDFRVVRYDHRGFGRSPAATGAYSAVDDVLRLLDHLGIARAHLVGNSMGGGVALDFARVHPERTARVVVAASGANGYPVAEADVESVLSVFRAAQAEGLERAAGMWLDHPMVAVTSREAALRPRLWAMISENRGVFGMRHWPEDQLEPTTYAQLQEIQAPTLFILGDRDIQLVRLVATESAHRMPHAELRVIPGADHLPQMTHPAEFAALVLEFLAPR